MNDFYKLKPIKNIQKLIIFLEKSEKFKLLKGLIIFNYI